MVGDAFNGVIISNNLDEISKCISADWILVDSQGGIISKELFYYAVEQPHFEKPSFRVSKKIFATLD